MAKPEQLIGSKLGKYTLVEYLGEGAMAQVYKALHPDLQRYAAIKLLHSNYLDSPHFLSRFKTEAQNLALLKHPNIVQVYDASIAGKYPYIVMEMIPGETLKEYIDEFKNRKTRIPLQQTLRIIYSVGLALAYAHQNNIVHRDVKPSNILLEESGRVVLTDFGLARLVSPTEMEDAESLEGTPAYISPEQALGRTSRPTSDMYSLGVVFFELLTGRQPFNSTSPINVAISHVAVELPPPSRYVPEIPEEIEAIVMKSTRKNPNERYSTMDDFLKDLTQVRIKTKTAKLPTASLANLKMKSDQAASWSAPARPAGSPGALVCLHIVDTGQVLELGIHREYLIGRRHKTQPIIPDIDLTPFNAYEWGISRLHASFSVHADKVSITDIGSSNGTWHGGRRLPVNEAVELKHGDVIHLGKLKMQVLIYT